MVQSVACTRFLGLNRLNSNLLVPNLMEQSRVSASVFIEAVLCWEFLHICTVAGGGDGVVSLTRGESGFLQTQNLLKSRGGRRRRGFAISGELELETHWKTLDVVTVQVCHFVLTFRT